MSDSTALAVQVGERIRLAREAAGMSKTQLGSAIGTSEKAVYYYERGEREPPLDTLRLIAENTGKPLSWFFSTKAQDVMRAAITELTSQIQEGGLDDWHDEFEALRNRLLGILDGSSDESEYAGLRALLEFYERTTGSLLHCGEGFDYAEERDEVLDVLTSGLISRARTAVAPAVELQELKDTIGRLQAEVQEGIEQVGSVVYRISQLPQALAATDSPLEHMMREIVRDVVRAEVHEAIAHRRGEESPLLTAVQFTKDLESHRRWTETVLPERVVAKLAGAKGVSRPAEDLREDLDKELGLGSKRVAKEQAAKARAE